MANIVIIVDRIEYGPTAGTVRIRGKAVADGRGKSVHWIADVALGAVPSTQSAAIQDAAVAALEQVGVTVGAMDTKTLYGGAVSL